MEILVLLLTLILQEFSLCLSETCSVSLKVDIANKEPLILRPDFDTNNAFFYPQNKNVLSFDEGQEVLLACNGAKNAFATPGLTSVQYQTVTCVGGDKFSYFNQTIPFKQFSCQKHPEHDAVSTGNKCFNDKTEVDIGFQVQDKFIVLMNICFDEDNMESYISFSNITAAIGGSETNVDRGDFIAANFYTIPVDNLYQFNTQVKTFTSLLGSADLAHKYLKSGSSYLARGHFTAMTDFVFAIQQQATFYYINAAPQWQSFNNGNWLKLEKSCRSFASANNYSLEIYTGGFQVATLPDINNNDQELYLYANGDDRAIPVPRFYWKVVYHREALAGVAFVGLNNPYQINMETDEICTDVCDQITWVNWNRKDMTRGYSYCCDVNEFRKIVQVLPPFDVEQLLVY